jgi:hypothetical protein
VADLDSGSGATKGSRLSRVTTDRALVYPGVLEALLSAAWHRTAFQELALAI